MSNLYLFWHRRDLRLEDNLGLNLACENHGRVIGCFCLDPHILQKEEVAPARLAYLRGCLVALAAAYQEIGGTLLFLQGQPEVLIPELVRKLSIQGVYWNLDVEPYSQKRDQSIKGILEKQGVKVVTTWDQLLHPPGTILTKSEDPYKVYSPFWKNWSQQTKLAPVKMPELGPGLTEGELTKIVDLFIPELPTPREMGYHWDYPLLLEPGSKPAATRLADFCQHQIDEYAENRNFPAVDGTSCLSAALKFGAIGIRKVWQATTELAAVSNSEETSKSIQTWQQELCWREFYQHALYFFPELADGPYREQFQDFPWENNQEYFAAWCEGKTGYPIVDAAMRQLNQTGWMHNRCRMIVASFLTKDLIINWQWGEKYFMQTLFDGDLSANNGGWQWSASSGMDPKPLRIFNPASQAQKFDPQGEYIRQWLPELSSVDTEYLVTGKIPSDECDRTGYPLPIVDHRLRQQEFKRLYQLQKY